MKFSHVEVGIFVAPQAGASQAFRTKRANDVLKEA
jgi:hypothetical protein